MLLKEFQEGMKNLVYRVRPRKFIVETHGWVYKKIKESQELQSLYSIKELPVKKPKNVIATEILCLMAWPYIFRNFKAIKEISMRERSVYKLEFIRRGK